ncbi:hypothetical protein HK096_000620, partial [Nowakowskiella sp. JEL0078]
MMNFASFENVVEDKILFDALKVAAAKDLCSEQVIFLEELSLLKNKIPKDTSTTSPTKKPSFILQKTNSVSDQSEACTSRSQSTSTTLYQSRSITDKFVTVSQDQSTHLPRSKTAPITHDPINPVIMARNKTYTSSSTTARLAKLNLSDSIFLNDTYSDSRTNLTMSSQLVDSPKSESSDFRWSPRPMSPIDQQEYDMVPMKVMERTAHKSHNSFNSSHTKSNRHKSKSDSEYEAFVAHCKKIVDVFIHLHSPLELNLSAYTRNEILERARRGSFSVDMFDKVKQDVMEQL